MPEDAHELIQRNALGVISIEALEDGLEGVARAVLLTNDLWQPKQRANGFVGTARLDHFDAREHAIAVGVDARKSFDDRGNARRLPTERARTLADLRLRPPTHAVEGASFQSCGGQGALVHLLLCQH